MIPFETAEHNFMEFSKKLRANVLRGFSTEELVSELERRNHSVFTIGDKCEYCITADHGEDVAICAYGPVKIIVVRE